MFGGAPLPAHPPSPRLGQSRTELVCSAHRRSPRLGDRTHQEGVDGERTRTPFVHLRVAVDPKNAVFDRVPNAMTELSSLRDRNDLDRGRDRNACREAVQQVPYRAGATGPSPCVVDVFHAAIVASRRWTEQTEEARSWPGIHPNLSLGGSVTRSPDLQVTPSPSAFVTWRCLGPARSASPLRLLLRDLAWEREFDSDSSGRAGSVLGGHRYRDRKVI
jgi:hypothetical protein